MKHEKTKRLEQPISSLLLFIIIVLVIFITGISANQKTYQSRRINPHAPNIDGLANDPVWGHTEIGHEFIQLRPSEGQAASEKTEFQIVYDDNTLYVLIKALDSKPSQIVKRLARRDNGEGDQVCIQLDSYQDQRTAFCFAVNAAGIKNDYLISENGEREDENWDPIWLVKTRHHDWGWSAEMAIPLSQLRFNSQEEQNWGLQVRRSLHRSGEVSAWKLIPQSADGYVSHFGTMTGIKGLKPQKPIEMTPYLVANHHQFSASAANPFTKGRDYQAVAGLDGRLAIGNDFSLNFTINPDFGQVEADPSEVNLTAYESYFAERRPFFIEGANLYSFPLAIGDGDNSRDGLFYSRRIGRAPRYSPDLSDDEFIDSPGATTILGAFKLSGKTQKGLSVGIIDGLTSREWADIGTMSSQRDIAVEPFTNYFGARVSQDFNGGNTILGGMLTAVNRKLDPHLQGSYHSAAYSGGIDFQHRWKKNQYLFQINAAFSQVMGSPEAIQNTQQSSLRYYQRPDADYLSYNPQRTSLSGHGGHMLFGKVSGSHWRYLTGLLWRSPGFEINDMGYLRQADNIMQYLWAGYSIWEPSWIFRRFNVNINQWAGWNFGGDNTYNGGNVNFGTEFTNFWSGNFGINFQGRSLSTMALRGGPLMEIPGGLNLWFGVGTDNRKHIRLSLNGSIFQGAEQSRSSEYLAMSLILQPSSSINLSVGPSMSWNRNQLQYVATVESEDQNRYILSAIDQTTFGLTLRANISLTPDLSIQFYGQPFISSAQYSEYKEVTSPRADRFGDRFNIFGENQIRPLADDSGYQVTGHDGRQFSFERPDFNFLQFRANLVLRWEFKPGSSLFVVWSQDRTDCFDFGRFQLGHDMRELFDIPAGNVFLVKVSHRFSL